MKNSAGDRGGAGCGVHYKGQGECRAVKNSAIWKYIINCMAVKATLYYKQVWVNPFHSAVWQFNKVYI